MNKPRKGRLHAYIVAALVVWLNAGAAPSRSGVTPGTNIAVVCLGDSITRAGYPAELGKILGVSVLNAGIGGNTSRQGLARLQRDVLTYKPAVVIAFFGANDSRQDAPKIHVPLEEYEKNLNEIVTRCRNAGAQVVLGTPPPIDPEPYYQRHPKEKYEPVGGLEAWLAKYRAAALKIAESNKVPIVDLNRLLAKEPAWRKTDGVHPTEQGNETIARMFAKVVGPMVRPNQSARPQQQD